MSAYTESGVDINKGNEIAKYLGFKDFGATIKCGGQELVMSTDGVGTKILVAEAQQKFDTIGIDLVAMCANDILTKFAKPTAFLDYYATGKLDIKKSKEILDGILEGCRLADCQLMGGETAEMPGVYEGSKFDLAGFIVGFVDSFKSMVELTPCSGDLLVGIPSSGPHSNGFSLLRSILPIEEIPLTPTRIYTKEILENMTYITACAHITGGGLFENIPRVLGKHKFELTTDIIDLKQDSWWSELYSKCKDKMDMKEFLTVFNGGWGMVLVVDPKDIDNLNISDIKVIGKVI
jgi:phosphoribosylformylglycinamidine cyclo-ligase